MNDNDNDFDYGYVVEGAKLIGRKCSPPVYNPLNRPEIHWKKPIILTVVFLVLTAGIIIPGVLVNKYILFALIPWVILAIAIFGKKAIIFAVHVYQNKAPDNVRLRCVFEPSCSEYMILALQKYGLIKGLAKGIHRLFRCHSPNGGVDYP